MTQNEPKKEREWHERPPIEDRTDPPKWLNYLFVIGLCTLSARLILDSQFANGTALYIILPFFTAFVIHRFIPYSKAGDAGGRHANAFRNATIVMLASSALLFEGFLCVLMFMPIYYFFALLGFLFAWADETPPGDKGKLRVFALPAIVVLLSLEGITPATTLPRHNTVTYTATVPANIVTLKANMAEPIAFERERDWFISLFPLPVKVEAGSLQPGDIHTLKFVYKRWFFTNIHSGTLRLRLDEVGDRHVRTTVVENTSYLANYLALKGTEVHFKEADDDHTQVSIRIHYERLLDPIWYFGPMQQLAVEQSARYLVETVIARGRPLG